ncbi:hypothetical protein AB0N81_03320 [Streptomyces sp. NPDC093510]|uniref:hypothetical protein n=1 Tax=Streptomyces sp. NPDC093510 TaxID=3155199 RepID=UPI0034186A0D
MPEISELLDQVVPQEELPTDTVAVFCGDLRSGRPDPVAHDVHVVTVSPWAPAGSTARSVPLDPARVATLTRHVRGQRYAVTCWTESQAEQVLAKTGRDRLAAAGVAPLLVETEELLVQGIVTGRARNGHAAFDGWRERAERSAFRDIAVTRSLGDAEGSVEDAVGQLASGDLHSAVLSARKAFGHTVDALLEGQGSYGTYTPEWRARRVREVAPKALGFDEYWAIETMSGLRVENSREWVGSVLSVCRRLLAEQPEHLVRGALRGPRRGW